MSSMRMAIAWGALATALVVIGGCSDTISQGGTTSTRPSVSAPTGTANSAIPGGSRSPRQICEGSLRSAVILDWAPGTVAEFRAYQYGGPTATVPLAHAFPGMSGNARGAWCGTKEGPDATHWWAVVVGHEPATVITVHGPGEGVRHGPVAAPPHVP